MCAVAERSVANVVVVVVVVGAQYIVPHARIEIFVAVAVVAAVIGGVDDVVAVVVAAAVIGGLDGVVSAVGKSCGARVAPLDSLAAELQPSVVAAHVRIL